MNKKLFEILVCPLCKGKLLWDDTKQELICKFDRLAFPVKEDIPVMLEEEARQMSLEEVERW